MVTTTLSLDADLIDKVKRLADAEQRTLDWVMREAIADYVERADMRASFKRDALEALAHYEATGHHLTGQEIDSWMETWGTDRETEAPACHV